MKRIEKAFQRTRENNCAAFMPFLTAGDPDIDTTVELILECERRGGDLIELGIPFSDPIADGPTIQASYVRALARNLKVKEIFEAIKTVRQQSQIPILTMVSVSIVSKIGPETYFDQAASAGVDGVIIPDLPPEDGAETAALAEKAGLDMVYLVAPTTPPERMKQIAGMSRGFIYYISVAGTTGARAELPPELVAHIQTLKASTEKPVAVGFGISTPNQVQTVAQVADGVIVGSAIVKRIAAAAGRPRDALVADIGDFIAKLAQGKVRQ
ncbi:MAG: tryptophan synthase subunit alpha [Alphaproteobacteria bacterium]